MSTATSSKTASNLTEAEKKELQAPSGNKRKSRADSILPPMTPKLAIGLTIVGIIAFFAIVVPFFVQDPNKVSDVGLTAPSAEHWLGTTQTGQDVFAQLAYACRGSLFIGVTVGILAVALSSFFGILGAYVGGATDEAFSLLSNVMLVIPGLPLMIVIASYMPNKSAFLVAGVLALTSWAGPARVLRGYTMSVRSRDYVLAARVAGEKPWRILFVEIFPNLIPLRIPGHAGRDCRNSRRSWTVLSGLGCRRFIHLGHHALLRSERHGPDPRRMVVVRALRPVHRTVRCGVGPHQLLRGRDRQPEAQGRHPQPDQEVEARGEGRQGEVRRRIPRRQCCPCRSKGVRGIMIETIQNNVLPPVYEQDPVLEIDDFCVEYRAEKTVQAVKHVNLKLGRGEVLGLAGESGCGKSTLAYGVNRLLKPPAVVTSGRVVFNSREGYPIDVRALEGEDLRMFRWEKISMVFQGAMNSLNPVKKIKDQLGDVFTTHRPDMSKKERLDKCGELLERVGVDRNRLNAYPHELSGGMRQRVMIAMAMALDPQVMIMDEPTTALDVVVQREILREITRLKDEFGFAVIFITHDLPLLLEISDRIAVMRKGEIVEMNNAMELYTHPQNEYTAKLLDSFPSLTGDRGSFIRTGSEDLAMGTSPFATKE